MPYITVGTEGDNCIDLHYEDRGSGAPVILIHGYPLNSASWEGQAGALIGAGFRVITYDRRGMGKSSSPLDGYDYDTFTGDLHQIIDQLHLSGVTLVGFSMGGGEVARYFRNHGSERISKAVFISGVPPFTWKERDEGASPGLQVIVGVDRRTLDTEFYRDLCAAAPGQRVNIATIEANWTDGSRPSVANALTCVATWYEEFDEDLDCVDVPTLVIHGDSDRIAPITVLGLQTVSSIADVRLSIVEGGPHGIIWSHPGQVNRELVAFLREGPDLELSAVLDTACVA